MKKITKAEMLAALDSWIVCLAESNYDPRKRSVPRKIRREINVLEAIETLVRRAA